MNNGCTCHAILAACYQLVQSVLKKGFALANRMGWKGGRSRYVINMAATLAACRKGLAALAGQLFSFLAQTGVAKAKFHIAVLGLDI